MLGSKRTLSLTPPTTTTKALFPQPLNLNAWLLRVKAAVNESPVKGQADHIAPRQVIPVAPAPVVMAGTPSWYPLISSLDSCQRSPRYSDRGGTQTHQVHTYTRACGLTLSQDSNSLPEATHIHSPQYLHLFLICSYWELINFLIFFFFLEMCAFRVALMKFLREMEAKVSFPFPVSPPNNSVA